MKALWPILSARRRLSRNANRRIYRSPLQHAAEAERPCGGGDTPIIEREWHYSASRWRIYGAGRGVIAHRMR